jgi:hypothetical protein
MNEKNNSIGKKDYRKLREDIFRHNLDNPDFNMVYLYEVRDLVKMSHLVAFLLAIAGAFIGTYENNLSINQYELSHFAVGIAFLIIALYLLHFEIGKKIKSWEKREL